MTTTVWEICQKAHNGGPKWTLPWEKVPEAERVTMEKTLCDEATSRISEADEI